MRVYLTWSDREAHWDLPLKVIVKVPKSTCIQSIMEELSIGEETDDNTKACQNAVDFVHGAECTAYDLLLREKPPPLPLPEVYCCKADDMTVLILEDLSDRAGNVADLAQGLNLKQWQNATDCLADLHAWSLTTKVPWRQSVGGSEAVAELFKTWEIDVERLLNNREKYRRVIPDVLQHGDTWMNNILFKKDKNGQITDEVAAFMDWQLSFAGCGLSDLAQLTSICVNHRLRQEQEKNIIKRYYDRFMLKAGGMLDKSVTFDRVWKVFQHTFAVSSLINLLMTDFLSRLVAKASESESDLRRHEIVSRMKACYDDAARFMNEPEYDQF